MWICVSINSPVFFLLKTIEAAKCLLHEILAMKTTGINESWITWKRKKLKWIVSLLHLFHLSKFWLSFRHQFEPFKYLRCEQIRNRRDNSNSRHFKYIGCSAWTGKSVVCQLPSLQLQTIQFDANHTISFDLLYSGSNVNN